MSNVPKWMREGKLSDQAALEEDEVVFVQPTTRASEMARIKAQAQARDEQANTTRESNRLVKQIKAQVIEKTKRPDTTVARIAKPGEFVVMFKGDVACVGSLIEAKEKIESIIMDYSDDLTDDDFVIFKCMPLTTFIETKIHTSNKIT